MSAMVFSRRRRKVEIEREHNEINRRLDEQHNQLRDFARRLRRLELEAGLHDRPPLMGVEGDVRRVS